MEKFIDRKAEMETLQSEYERKGSSLVIYMDGAGLARPR